MSEVFLHLQRRREDPFTISFDVADVPANAAPVALLHGMRHDGGRRWFRFHDDAFWRPLARVPGRVRIVDIKLAMDASWSFHDPYDWLDARRPPPSDDGEVAMLVSTIENDCIAVDGVLHVRSPEPLLVLSTESGRFLQRWVVVPTSWWPKVGGERPTQTMFSPASLDASHDFATLLSGGRRVPVADVDVVLPGAFTRDEERCFAEGVRDWVLSSLSRRSIAMAPLPIVRILRRWRHAEDMRAAHVTMLGHELDMDPDAGIRAGKDRDEVERDDAVGMLRRTLPLALRRARHQFPDSASLEIDLPELDDLEL